MYIHIYHRGTPAKKVTIANWSRSETSPCLAWSIDIPSTLTALTLTAGSAAEKNHMQGWDGMIPRPLDIPDWRKANKTCVFFSMQSLMFHRFVKLVLVAFEHSANTNEMKWNDIKWNEWNGINEMKRNEMKWNEWMKEWRKEWRK